MNWRSRIRRPWFSVYMALHVEPTRQTYKWVRRWKVKAYQRGGWTRWKAPR